LASGPRAEKVRGEQAIRAAADEAQKAALRNAHKPDYRRARIGDLFDLLKGEFVEFEEAVLSGDLQWIREELGDVIWCAVMIADHDCALGGWATEEVVS
jgi:NTP pyrophosphatase (non-canonical NTP hydrolase)